MKGLLLVNTGSPDSPATKDVRRYLSEFLTDPRVMDMPALPRHLLVRGIIAPLRAPKSAEKYRHIFTPEGKPLLLSETEKLARLMSQKGSLPVYVAMRYGRPAVAEAFRKAETDGVTELKVIPMFPQYAMSSFETAAERVFSEYTRLRPPFELTFARPYYSHPLLIEAFAERIAAYAEPGDLVLCSYHGVPLSQVKPYADDPDRDYPSQTEETTRLLARHPLLKGLNLTLETVYQSRFGNGKWTLPNTQTTLLRLRDEGRKRVVVVCPGFLCDNLETVYEIGVEGRELFEKGRAGASLVFVPSPGASEALAGCLLSTD